MSLSSVYRYSLLFRSSEPSYPLDRRIQAETWGHIPRIGDLINLLLDRDTTESVIVEVVRVFYDTNNRDSIVVYVRHWDNNL